MTTTPAPTTADLYAAFPDDLAALARDGEARLTRALLDAALAQPALQLEMDAVVRNYRRVALPLLTAVTAHNRYDLDGDSVANYLAAQLDREIAVLEENALVRVREAQRAADAHFAETVEALARRSAIAAQRTIAEQRAAEHAAELEATRAAEVAEHARKKALDAQQRAERAALRAQLTPERAER